MKGNTCITIFLLFLVGLANATELLTPVDAADLKLSTQQKDSLKVYQADPKTIAVTLVTIDIATLSAATPVTLTLPNHDTLVLSHTKINSVSKQEFTWSSQENQAKIEAVIHVNTAQAIGTLRIGKQVYHLRPLGDTIHALIQVNETISAMGQQQFDLQM